MTSALVAVLPGALLAAGLLAALAALRPASARDARRPRHPARHRWHALRGVRARTLTAALVGVLVLLTTGWPVAALAVATALLVLPRLLAHRDTDATIERLAALAAWARRIADVLGAGAGGLEQAVVSAARTPPEPIAAEAAALAVRVHTRGLEPALRLFAAELADPAADEVIAALILRARAGGRGLGEVLAAQADALAAEAAARRDVEADRVKPRTDMRLVITITGVVLAGLLLFSRDFLAPYDSPLGQLVMAAIAALMGMSVWWMHLRSRPPHTRLRLLDTNPDPGSVEVP